MTSTETFTWGAFGSIVPEVVRLYKIATSDNPVLNLRVSYFVISLVFVGVAGMFTIAFGPENRWKAMWVGVSFPVLVTTLLTQPPAVGGQ